MGKRLYFENSGGSLRLKAAAKVVEEWESIPDCSLRNHETAQALSDVQNKGIEDIRCLFNAKSGKIFSTYTASMAMFEMVRAVIESVEGGNIVTTTMEHPSAFDSCKVYADKFKKELRVASPNGTTGAIEIEEIETLIDQDTIILSVMASSNISGANMDIEGIVKAARRIKPEIYIIVDAVQYAPHGLIDVDLLQIDGMNIAPYKIFGNRGVAFAYLSDRLSKLPHHKLMAKEPNDWELGSATPADFAMFSKVVDYICWLGKQMNPECREDRRELFEEGMKAIKNQEQALLNRMLVGTDSISGLRDIEGVNAHFDNKDLSKRSLILGLTFDDMDCAFAAQRYREKGFIVYERLASSAYSKRILESVNLEGIVRVSPLHCNNQVEIDAFLKATKEIVMEGEKGC